MATETLVISDEARAAYLKYWETVLMSPYRTREGLPERKAFSEFRKIAGKNYARVMVALMDERNAAEQASSKVWKVEMRSNEEIRAAQMEAVQAAENEEISSAYAAMADPPAAPALKSQRDLGSPAYRAELVPQLHSGTGMRGCGGEAEARAAGYGDEIDRLDALAKQADAAPDLTITATFHSLSMLGGDHYVRMTEQVENAEECVRIAQMLLRDNAHVKHVKVFYTNEGVKVNLIVNRA